jgi:ribosome-associated protein
MKKTRKKSDNTSSAAERLAQVIIHGMQEKKAADITLIDLRGIKKAVADFFVICSGTSDTHVDAIMQSIDNEVIKSLHEEPWHIEGRENRQWILLDYVDVVAHVFQRDTREFFGLEELWGDAQITNIPNPS